MIAWLASRQYGAVARHQLLEAGVSAGEIAHRVRSRRLHRMHQGVYIVGHTATAPLAFEAAAMLACGPDSLLSHRTAGWLHELIEARPAVVDVTVVGRALAQRTGIRVHRTTKLTELDRARQDGLRVTSPARTLLDLAAVIASDELEALVSDACHRGLLTEAQLREQLERHPRRIGTPRLRAILDEPGGAARTRSHAERLLLRLIRDAGLPRPATNRVVRGYEVDVVWLDQRLVVEFDSFAFHGDRRSFERDRRRDAALAASGYTVVRLTWRRLRDEPHAVVAQLARLLERGSGRLAA